MPEAFQKAVLEFTVRLSTQLKAHAVRDEEVTWNALSLMQADRDNSDDTEPEYEESDIKTKMRNGLVHKHKNEMD
ncbi:MAG: hypothetical protein Q9P90_07925 [candidate division KSB1 bacterium]|nr:hypothetical protein [candidate division KSB1 bacterium]